jgi:hypothetical protein
VDTTVGARGLSERLRQFVNEAPYERQPIFEFVAAAAESTAPGARVLDVGAGSAPYRELFDHAEYTTADWEQCVHVEDQSFDVVLNTQVLEDGGMLFLTVPLVEELHRLPHGYYRYTPSALDYLLGGAGFAEVEITPRNDCFTTLAQLLLNARWIMGRRADGLDDRRDEAAAVLEEMAEQIARLAPLDARWELPLGFTVSARRPSAS